MRKQHKQANEVHQCTFQANISHANAAIKFACKMFVSWRSMTNKVFAKTANDNVPLQNGLASFNQKLTFQTHLLYNKISSVYLKKDTTICLMLISSRKPDEQKLVGRISVDLASVVNDNSYNEQVDHKLTFCSIPNSSINLSIKCISHEKTELNPYQMDLEEFSIIGRNLNQSTNSNNGDIVGEKTITKVLSADIFPTKNKGQSQVQRAQQILDKLYGNRSIRQQRAKRQHVQSKVEEKALPQSYVTQIITKNQSQPVIEKKEILQDLQQRKQQPAIQQPKQEQNIFATFLNSLNKNSQVKENNPIAFHTEQRNIKVQEEEQSEQEKPQTFKFIVPDVVQEEANSEDHEKENKDLYINHVQIDNQREEIPIDNQREENIPIDNEREDNTPIVNEREENIPNVNEKELNIPIDSEREERNNFDILEFEFQKKKQENQKIALEELLSQANYQLQQERTNSNRLKNQLQDIVKQIQQQKNKTIQQLLIEIKENVSRNQQLEQKIRQYESYAKNYQNFEEYIINLREQFEQSQKKRIDYESELLELRFEVSEIQNFSENQDKQLRNRQQQIERLNKIIQQLKSCPAPINSSKIEDAEKSVVLYRSYSNLSEKQRQGFNQQVQILKRKIFKLTQELQFTETVKQNFELYNKACQSLEHEKQSLLSELKKLQEQKQIQGYEGYEGYEQKEENLNIQELEQEKIEKQENNFQKQLEQLHEELKKARSQLIKFNKQKNELETEISNIKEQNEFLKQVLEKKQSDEQQISQNQQKFQNLEQQYNFLKQLYSEKEQEQAKIGKDMDEIKFRLQDKEQYIITLENKLIRLESSYQDIINQLNKQILVLRAELQSNIEILKSKEHEMNATTNGLSSIEGQVGELKSEIINLQKEKALLNQLNQTLQGELNKLEIQKSQYENILKTLEGQKSKLHESLKKTKAEVERQGQQIDELKSSLRKANIQLQKQQRKQKEKQVAIAQLETGNHQSMKKMVEEKSELITKLEEALKEQKSKVQDLQERSVEKQRKMRENVLILEEESRKIYQILVEKEQKEEAYEQMLEQQNAEILQLKYTLNEKSNAQQKLHEYISRNRGSYQLKQAQNVLLEPEKEQGQSQKLYLVEKQLDGQKNKRIRLQKQLFKIGESKELLQKQLQQIRKQVYSYESQLYYLRSAIKQSQGTKKVQPATQLESKSESQLRKLKIQIQKIKDNNSQLSAVNEKLRQKLSELEALQQKNLKKINQFLSQIESLEGEIYQQQGQKKKLILELEESKYAINRLKNQIEDNQVKQMNNSLHKQFQMIKQQSNHQLKKSIANQNGVSYSNQDIVEACQHLQQLIKQRSEKDKNQAILELIINKNALLEGELMKITEEKGLIQQNARKLSMQFQKVKAKILKGRASHQEKNDLLTSLKPCESKVNDFVKLTQKLFDSQLEIDGE